jgi:hypothetical protein
MNSILTGTEYLPAFNGVLNLYFAKPSIASDSKTLFPIVILGFAAS